MGEKESGAKGAGPSQLADRTRDRMLDAYKTTRVWPSADLFGDY